jgi:hypothetical protein
MLRVLERVAAFRDELRFAPSAMRLTVVRPDVPERVRTKVILVELSLASATNPYEKLT